MDPDTALEELRKLMARNLDGSYSEDIANLFEGLDKWLSDGGFLPKAWNRHRRATL